MKKIHNGKYLMSITRKTVTGLFGALLNGVVCTLFKTKSLYLKTWIPTYVVHKTEELHMKGKNITLNLLNLTFPAEYSSVIK